MREKGTHTYDLYLEYCRCPQCGFIQEIRQEFEYRLGKYGKELQCGRCGYHFIEIKNIQPKFGPLFG